MARHLPRDDDTTCGNWTSSGEGSALVGHHDRVGGGANPTSWNSAHASRAAARRTFRAPAATACSSASPSADAAVEQPRRHGAKSPDRSSGAARGLRRHRASRSRRARAARRGGPPRCPAWSGRTLWMVNSTELGGGVAEMLPTMISLLRELGVRTEWVVIETDRTRILRYHQAAPQPDSRRRAIHVRQ
jgi:hypothetical protein